MYSSWILRSMEKTFVFMGLALWSFFISALLASCTLLVTLFWYSVFISANAIMFTDNLYLLCHRYSFFLFLLFVIFLFFFVTPFSSKEMQGYLTKRK